MFYTPKQKGLFSAQIDEICERLFKEAQEMGGYCGDCGVPSMTKHEENCDIAKCTSCGLQRLSCFCEDGDSDIWEGLWPGIKDCYELKMICFDTATGEWCFDLNEWARIQMKRKNK